MGDLFEKIKTVSLKYKTNSLPSVSVGCFNLPALTAGVQNQGLNNYVPRENATILKNVISISANGANTGATFYQSREFTVLQDAYAIKWTYTHNQLSDNQSLFLVGCISKTIYGNYEWTNKAGWERIKNDSISLPLSFDGSIDFDFMETFIRELEEERIRELEEERIRELSAYLAASGLSDTNLSDDEREALLYFQKTKWDYFRLGDLFDIKPTKWYKLSNEEILSPYGTVPLVSNSSSSNGVMGFSCLPANNLGNSISCSDTTLGADTMYYQKNDFIGYQHIQHLVPKFSPFNSSIAFMIISATRVATLNAGYDYAHKFNRTAMNNTKVLLPVNSDGLVDFVFMDNFVSAIHKLVIMDVVSFADRKIESTRKVCSTK